MEEMVERRQLLQEESLAYFSEKINAIVPVVEGTQIKLTNADVLTELEIKFAKIRNLVVTKDDYKYCTDLKAETNKIIKEIETYRKTSIETIINAEKSRLMALEKLGKSSIATLQEALDSAQQEWDEDTNRAIKNIYNSIEVKYCTLESLLDAKNIKNGKSNKVTWMNREYADHLPKLEKEIKEVIQKYNDDYVVLKSMCKTEFQEKRAVETLALTFDLGRAIIARTNAEETEKTIEEEKLRRVEEEKQRQLAEQKVEVTPIKEVKEEVEETPYLECYYVTVKSKEQEQRLISFLKALGAEYERAL